MQFLMEYGDTNFIGVVNPTEYRTFVDHDWELDTLLQRFVDEMNQGNIIVLQMTNEGIEYSWKVEVQIEVKPKEQECFRKAKGYIRVTDNQLFLVDYDCLTMAAQFEDEQVPDKNCSSYKIELENGLYEVNFVQYYNVDEDEHYGSKEVDISMYFLKVLDFPQNADKVIWCTY